MILKLSLQLIKSLGSWSVTSGAASGAWDESRWSIESSVANADLYALYPFFSIYVGTDDKNSSANIISVSIALEMVYVFIILLWKKQLVKYQDGSSLVSEAYFNVVIE